MHNICRSPFYIRIKYFREKNVNIVQGITHKQT